MIRRSQVRKVQERSAAIMEQAHIVLTPSEKANIEVAEYGLDDFDRQGLELVVYVNTDRYCAKEMSLFPGQTCPEHRHPSVGGKPGKMETFRCRWGRVWLYVEGEPVSCLKATVPEGSETYYTVFRNSPVRAAMRPTSPLTHASRECRRSWKTECRLVRLQTQ